MSLFAVSCSHFGHLVSGESVIFWNDSQLYPHWQLYSYVGMVAHHFTFVLVLFVQNLQSFDNGFWTNGFHQDS